MVVNLNDRDRSGFLDPAGQILFDLRSEGRNPPIVNDVLESRSLSVGAIAEIAVHFQHGLADLPHVAPLDVTERKGQERKRLLRARCRPETSAYQNVVSHNAA